MRYKIFCSFFGIAFFLFAYPAFSQKQVFVSGKFESGFTNSKVTVYKPYDGYFNIFYPDEHSETSIINDEFNVSFLLDKAGFVRLEGKGMPKTYFFAEPGDSIYLSFSIDTSGITHTKYSGKNEGANNLLANLKLLNNNSSSSKNSKDLIISILKSEGSAESIFNQLENEINKCTLPLEPLLVEGKISKSCYEAYVSETQQKMLSWAGSYIQDYFIRFKEHTGTENQKLKELTRMLYDRYDPYKGCNRIATTNYTNTLIKSLLRKENILNSEKPKMLFWEKWDKKLNMVVSGIGCLEYAPDTTKMYFIGNALLTASVFKPLTEDEFSEIVFDYYERYPESPYIPELMTILARSKNNTNSISNSDRNIIHFLEDENKQLVELKDLKIDSIAQIQDLIKSRFMGKAVFVDFWASWCSPCIAEFRNEPKLRKFLDEKNIQMLYVSVDHPRSAEKWKTTVDKYDLIGYHILVKGIMAENLAKWVAGIPRYMLFNANGELLHDNLLRPSKGEALFGQINSLMEN